MSKQLIIPWGYINPRYTSAELTEGGRVVFYAPDPVTGDDKYSYIDSFILKIDTEGVDWRNSLTKRP